MAERQHDGCVRDDGAKTVLVVGASRGIGLGLVSEYLRRGWAVIATARKPDSSALGGLVDEAGGRLSIERLDITRSNEISALHERLAGARLDLLLVNAGITNGDVPVSKVSASTFDEVMRTNALGPMRVVEALQELVAADGTIAVMSSRQGSITLNDNAGYEVYRASKSALNQLMRCYAARHRGESRTLLLISPGWVQTELGGTAAPLRIEDSVPGVIDTIAAHPASGELQFLDYRNQILPW